MCVSFNWFPFIFLSSSRSNEFYKRRERTWSDRKEVFFGLSAIRLIDSPMHLTFKTFLNIHPSLECGRNPITREGHKERVLFNRFNWNYFPLFPHSFLRREMRGIFVTIEVSCFFLSNWGKIEVSLFISSFSLSTGSNGKGFVTGQDIN